MSAPNSSVVSAATTEMEQDYSIVLGEKGKLQAITISLGPAILGVV